VDIPARLEYESNPQRLYRHPWESFYSPTLIADILSLNMKKARLTPGFHV
jgi:hypothetical protein